MAVHDFGGKRVLVTGAGKGIGCETAQLLARFGADVIALSRTAADLRYSAHPLVVDLADTEATRAAVTSVLPIDLLVNCAGIVELESVLDAITQVMALELGPHGIRVNSLNPIVTLTPMADKAWSDPTKSAPMLARIPLGRFAQPTDVAAAIAFLLSDDAAMINGITLTLDGGFSVG